ncbi:MAG TPA: zinc-binding dehydrogenase, partial [Bryobacteraceae bacterium]
MGKRSSLEPAARAIRDRRGNETHVKRIRAVVQRGYGGPAVLELRSIDLGEPGEGEVRVRQSAIGVNFHDIYVRTGQYKTLTVPGVPGIEAVGVITAVGPNVEGWPVGRRVAYVDRGYGAYCEERLVSQDLLLAPPEELPDELIASSLVRGLTATMLMEQVFTVRASDLCLIHAVGGTTGRLLATWARHIGAQVVGTLGDPSKSPGVAALCDHVYSYSQEDWAEQIEAAYGASMTYVCDSVGAPTFRGSVALADRCGHIALFGQSGGAVQSVSVSDLAAKSLTLTRPILFDYLKSAARRAAMMRSFYSLVGEGVLQLQSPISLPLGDAGVAQAMLEQR